jgi:hypothetical protein
MEQYKCQCCGEFITEDQGITCHNGEWVCDNDSCRILDKNNESYIKEMKN